MVQTCSARRVRCGRLHGRAGGAGRGGHCQLVGEGQGDGRGSSSTGFCCCEFQKHSFELLLSPLWCYYCCCFHRMPLFVFSKQESGGERYGELTVQVSPDNIKIQVAQRLLLFCLCLRQCSPLCLSLFVAIFSNNKNAPPVWLLLLLTLSISAPDDFCFINYITVTESCLSLSLTHSRSLSLSLPRTRVGACTCVCVCVWVVFLRVFVCVRLLAQLFLLRGLICIEFVVQLSLAFICIYR